MLGTSWGAAPGAGFGAGLTSAGDMNGDGFADLAIGSLLAGGFSIYLGNARDLGDPGRVLLPRQAKRSGARLSPLARSDSETSIRLLARGRSAAGRRPLRLEWNIDYLSVLLLRVPIARSAWSRSGAPTAGQGSTRGLESGGERPRHREQLSLEAPHRERQRLLPEHALGHLAGRTERAPLPHAGKFSTIGVDDVRGTGPRWLSVAPNPARDRLTVRFSRPSAGRFARHAVDGTTLALFDAGAAFAAPGRSTAIAWRRASCSGTGATARADRCRPAFTSSNCAPGRRGRPPAWCGSRDERDPARAS
ncbi:MAG: FG-GAP repeat protein [Candidatus Eisenbacteria bacterium]